MIFVVGSFFDVWSIVGVVLSVVLFFVCCFRFVFCQCFVFVDCFEKWSKAGASKP